MRSTSGAVMNGSPTRTPASRQAPPRWIEGTRKARPKRHLPPLVPSSGTSAERGHAVESKVNQSKWTAEGRSPLSGFPCGDFALYSHPAKNGTS